MKILFVCTGNSCRSVMAEYLLKRLIDEQKLKGWEARSCGIAAEPNFPIPEEVQKALKAKGIGRVSHTPRPLTQELLAWADVALVMTRMHRDFLLDQFSEFRSKIRLFRDLAFSDQEDVEDPIGQSDRVYAECCDTLERGLKAILKNHATKSH